MGEASPRCTEEDRRRVESHLAGERRRTRRFFNLVSPAFHLIDRRLLPEYRAALEELSLDPSLPVLDLATGTGTLARAFAERGHAVTGFDFAERLLKRARRRLPSADLRRMDLADLPSFAGRSFGIVAMGYLLHGLDPVMRRFVLCESARIAARHVLVFDYARPGPWIVRLVEWVEGPHYPSFVDRPFPEQAAEAGLEVVREGIVSDVGGWWLLRHGTRPEAGEGGSHG